MSRAKWKGPCILELKQLQTEHIKKTSNIIVPRSIEITPKFIGLTFKVHNGKEYQEITITDDMIG